MFNERINESIGIVGTIDPQVVVDTEVFSDYVDMGSFQQIMAVLQTGDMAAKKINFKAYEAQDGSGTGEQALTGKALTEIAASATANDAKQYTISVRQEDLSSGFSHVRFGLVSEASQTGSMSAIITAINARFGFAANSNLASVAQKVA